MENIEPIPELQGYKFIFVMGVAHSGTTILYRLLGRHPELCWFSQFSQRTGSVPNRTKLPFSSLLNKYGRKFFKTPWKKKKDLSLYFIPRPMEVHKIWDYLLPERLVDKKELSEEEISNLKKRFRKIFLSEFEKWDKKAIICKLPRLVRATGLLNKLFSNIKIIHLARDGRAVALSNINKFGQEDDNRRKKLRLSAKHWKEEVRYMIDIKDNIKSENFMETKLEVLQSNFEFEFKNILEFLGLSYKKYPKPLPELRENTNDKYKKKASKEDIYFLENFVKKELKALGYKTKWDLDF